MSSVSSIDTSQYTTLLANDVFGNFEPAKEGAVAYQTEQVPNIAATEESTPKVDLNRYYSNVRPGDLLNETGKNVVNSAKQVDEAIVKAVEYGMRLEDAVKLQTAKAAYQANLNVMNAANHSTFELMVS